MMKQEIINISSYFLGALAYWSGVIVIASVLIIIICSFICLVLMSVRDQVKNTAAFIDWINFRRIRELRKKDLKKSWSYKQHLEDMRRSEVLIEIGNLEKGRFRKNVLVEFIEILNEKEKEALVNELQIVTGMVQDLIEVKK